MLAIKLVLTGVAVVLAVTGLVGYALVMPVFVRQSSVQRQHQLLIRHLAAADIITIMVRLTLCVAFVLLPDGWLGIPLPLNPTELCYHVVKYLTLAISLNRLAAIAQLRAVQWLFDGRKTMTIVLVLCWLWPVVHGLLMAQSCQYQLTGGQLSFARVCATSDLVPDVVVNVTLSSLIKKSELAADHLGNDTIANDTQMTELSPDKDFFKNLNAILEWYLISEDLIVIALLIIIYPGMLIPMNVNFYTCVYIFCTDLFSNISLLMVVLNSAINPALIALCSQQLRDQFRAKWLG